MTTVKIPRETFDQMREALEVLNSLDADINFLNTNELEEMVDSALSAAKEVPQPAGPEDMAIYKSIADGYLKAAHRKEIGTTVCNNLATSIRNMKEPT